MPVPHAETQMVTVTRNDDLRSNLFNGFTGKGGFAANHKKSLTTRSGSTVTFDDTAHTILLQTTRANKIFIDELNGTITISSAEEVNVNTKNVNINASENMNVNVGSVLNTIPTTKVAEEERAQNVSMAECLAAASGVCPIRIR